MTKASRARNNRRAVPNFRAIARRKWQDHGAGLALVAFHSISQQLGCSNREHLVLIARTLYGDDVANAIERRLVRLPDISKAARTMMEQYGYQDQDGAMVYVGDEPTAGAEDDTTERG